MSYRKPSHWLAIAVLITLIGGCGYAIRTSRIESVRIGKIENGTYEVKLDERLHNALAGAIMTKGIRINPASTHEIEGTLNDLTLKIVSESSGVATVYNVTVSGVMILTGPDKSRREIKSGNLYTVQFPSDGKIENVMALRDQAIDRAIADMAQEIAEEIAR